MYPNTPQHIQDAIHSYLTHMQGWTPPERGCEMADSILEIKHPVAVSIGVFSGRSVIAMGFAMRELGHGMVYGIDPYKVDAAIEGGGDDEDKKWWEQKSGLEDMAGYAAHQIWDHRLDQWATLIRNSSQFVASLFPEIGVLEIDGNHSEEASTRDVSLYLPRVIKNGCIYFDDANWQTTQKALSMLDSACDMVKEAKPEGQNSYRVYRKR